LCVRFESWVEVGAFSWGASRVEWDRVRREAVG